MLPVSGYSLSLFQLIILFKIEIFRINGEANDYFGKGLSGAEISVTPVNVSKLIASENQIIGNVALYGATSGKAFINGMAGERFAVRNSGAITVVEGVGDHGCEYMTGGTVVILGETGRNFAAGMSGGIAYIFDKKVRCLERVNPEMVDIDPLEPSDLELIEGLLNEHVAATGSEQAKAILKDWKKLSTYFIKIMPRDYKAALVKKKTEQKTTRSNG